MALTHPAVVAQTDTSGAGGRQCDQFYYSETATAPKAYSEYFLMSFETQRGKFVSFFFFLFVCEELAGK